MPERFYEQDPNTGQRYYTEKGWSEWKPVPVEKDPSTGEEYELWNEQWMKKAPAEEIPAEMPSLAKGGMVVAGSRNVAEDRLNRWAKANPTAKARYQKAIKRGGIQPGSMLDTELSMVLTGELDPDKPVDMMAVAKTLRERNAANFEADWEEREQQRLQDEYAKSWYPVKVAKVAVRGLLEGVPRGAKGLVDIVRSYDDVIRSANIPGVSTALKPRKMLLDSLANSLDYTSNTFQISKTLKREFGPNMGHWTDSLRDLTELATLPFEMMPQMAAGGTMAMENAGAAAGGQVLKALTKAGVKRGIATAASEAAAGALANAPQEVLLDSFNEWGSATQDIKQQLMAEGKTEQEATSESLDRTKNLLAQNLMLNTMLAPLDVVSGIYGKSAMARRAAEMATKRGGIVTKGAKAALSSLKAYGVESFQERAQEAFTMMAEQGKGWDRDAFMENFNSDRAKQAGRIGGAFGLAVHVAAKPFEALAAAQQRKAQAGQAV